MYDYDNINDATTTIINKNTITSFNIRNNNRTHANSNTIHLCLSCIPKYKSEEYCPCCGHMLDDIQYQIDLSSLKHHLNENNKDTNNNINNSNNSNNKSRRTIIIRGRLRNILIIQNWI